MISKGEAITIPEVKETIVMLRKMSADEKVRQEAYYREKRLHDEVTALSHARSEGIAEGRVEGREQECSEIIEIMRENGFTEEQIKLALTRRK